MFLPIKSDTGAVYPFEYLPAAGDEYKAGQLVNMEGGLVVAIADDQDTTPPYLCMADAAMKEGKLLPVIRISDDYIYETVFGEDVSDAEIGTLLTIKAGGLEAVEGDGSFEIVALFGGTDAGDLVRGRWV